MEVLVTTGMQVTGDLTADGQRAVGAGVCWNLVRDELIGSVAGTGAGNVEAVVRRVSRPDQMREFRLFGPSMSSLEAMTVPPLVRSVKVGSRELVELARNS